MNALLLTLGLILLCAAGILLAIRRKTGLTIKGDGSTAPYRKQPTISPEEFKARLDFDLSAMCFLFAQAMANFRDLNMQEPEAWRLCDAIEQKVRKSFESPEHHKLQLIGSVINYQLSEQARHQTAIGEPAVATVLREIREQWRIKYMRTDSGKEPFQSVMSTR